MRARLALGLGVGVGLVAAPLLGVTALAAGPQDSAPAASASSAPSAAAADPAAPSPVAADTGPDDAGALDAGSTWVSCVDKIPAGATRPAMRASFPARGFSGYALNLEVTITHGSGETVFPGGIKLGGDEAATKALKEVGFVIPNADGGAAFTIETTPSDVSSTTKVTLPFVALPKRAAATCSICRRCRSPSPAPTAR